eukprot:ctg_844.g288
MHEERDARAIRAARRAPSIAPSRRAIDRAIASRSLRSGAPTHTHPHTPGEGTLLGTPTVATQDGGVHVCHDVGHATVADGATGVVALDDARLGCAPLAPSRPAAVRPPAVDPFCARLPPRHPIPLCHDVGGGQEHQGEVSPGLCAAAVSGRRRGAGVCAARDGDAGDRGVAGAAQPGSVGRGAARVAAGPRQGRATGAAFVAGGRSGVGCRCRRLHAVARGAGNSPPAGRHRHLHGALGGGDLSARQHRPGRAVRLRWQFLHAVRGRGLSPHHLLHRPAGCDGALPHAYRGRPRALPGAAEQRQFGRVGCCTRRCLVALRGVRGPVAQAVLPVRVGGRKAGGGDRFVHPRGERPPGGPASVRARRRRTVRRPRHGLPEAGHALGRGGVRARVRSGRVQYRGGGRFQHGRHGEQVAQFVQLQVRAGQCQHRHRRRLPRHRGRRRARVLSQLVGQPGHLSRLVPAVAQGGLHRVSRSGVQRGHAAQSGGAAHCGRDAVAQCAVSAGRRPDGAPGASGRVRGHQQFLLGDGVRKRRRGDPHAAGAGGRGWFSSRHRSVFRTTRRAGLAAVSAVVFAGGHTRGAADARAADQAAARDPGGDRSAGQRRPRGDAHTDAAVDGGAAGVLSARRATRHGEQLSAGVFGAGEAVSGRYRRQGGGGAAAGVSDGARHRRFQSVGGGTDAAAAGGAGDRR